MTQPEKPTELFLNFVDPNDAQKVNMSLVRDRTSSALWLTTGTAVVLGAASYWNYRQKNKAIEMVSDLQHNFYAGASDVIRLYPEQVGGKTFLVTGATSGLGRHLARSLAQAGACVVVGVRNVEAGKAAVPITEDIRAKGGSVHVLELDLSSFASTRRFAQAVKELLQSKRIPSLDGLVHNAGIYGVAGQTEDGYQTTWQTNCLAPALLTELLMDSLSETARIVHVSSEMHRLVFKPVTQYCPPITTDGSRTWDYALSKACQIVHAHALQLRLDADDSSNKRRAFAIEPGLVQTKIARHKAEWISFVSYNLVGAFLLKTTDQGCSSMAFCLLAPDALLNNDDAIYYADCAPKAVGKHLASKKEAEGLMKLFEDIFDKSKSS